MCPAEGKRSFAVGTKVSSKTWRATQRWGCSSPQKVSFLKGLCLQLVFEIGKALFVLLTNRTWVFVTTGHEVTQLFSLLLLSVVCVNPVLGDPKIQRNAARSVMGSVPQAGELLQSLSYFWQGFLSISYRRCASLQGPSALRMALRETKHRFLFM